MPSKIAVLGNERQNTLALQKANWVNYFPSSSINPHPSFNVCKASPFNLGLS
jgi:hypothetical protein